MSDARRTLGGEKKRWMSPSQAGQGLAHKKDVNQPVMKVDSSTLFTVSRALWMSCCACST